MEHILIPSARVHALKDAISAIEKRMLCKISVENKNDVVIEGEPYIEYVVKNMVQAIARGFKLNTALKLLNSFGVNIRSVENMLGVLDKMHKNVNAVEFAKMLFGLGLKQIQVETILRRIGVDDLATSDIFDRIDEDKIHQSFGRVVELNVD